MTGTFASGPFQRYDTVILLCTMKTGLLSSDKIAAVTACTDVFRRAPPEHCQVSSPHRAASVMRAIQGSIGEIQFSMEIY